MSQQPHPDRVRLLPWPVPARLIDGVLIALTVIGAVARPAADDGFDPLLDTVVMLLAIGVILARRRYPLPALAVAIATMVVVTVATQDISIMMPAALVAVYHVATVERWPISLSAGAVAVVVFALVVITLLEQGRIEGGALASIAWPAFATAAGAGVRAGRESLAGAQDRAHRAEVTRELEARRRVSEERLRIARDVHDLVAHHLAVVNVQAGVAQHVLRTDPDAAEAALDTVRTSASTGVAELGELLSVLRAPDEEDGPVDPTPNLEAIDDLISSFGASGLVVEHATSGARRPLSSPAEVAAYRVVQEALTNAHKHGTGRATVHQRFDDQSLLIEVSNPADADKTTADADGGAPGYGLVGMRERVEAAGGELVVAAADGRFTVRATLPARGQP